MSTLQLNIFIDAFGWELLQRHQFLDDVLEIKRPLDTVFGYSSTCDPTILTGCMPVEHGHFSFYRYNPEKSPFGLCRILRLVPDCFMSRGRVRRLLSRVFQWYHGFTGYFQLYNMPMQYLPLFEYTELRDIYQPGGINGGQHTVFDTLRRCDIPFHLSDWRAGERENLSALTAALQHGHIRWAYLYLADMDAILHAHGTHASQVAKKIGWYDAQIRRLLAVARQHYSDVVLHIFSDHGMTDIIEDFDLIAQIDTLDVAYGVDYIAMYDSTMARFWFHTSKAREQITQLLQTLPQGHVMSEEELENFGCAFANEEYGEMFYLLNPGVLMCPSFMNATGMAGMHGYDPAHMDSLAMYASNEHVLMPPRRLDDLYALMLRDVTQSESLEEAPS